MSGLLLTSVAAQQTPTAEPDPLASKQLPGAVTSRRDFPVGDTLAVYAEVYDNNPSRQPRQIDVAVRLISAQGTDVFSATDSMSHDSGTVEHLRAVQARGSGSGFVSPARRSEGERHRRDPDRPRDTHHHRSLEKAMQMRFAFVASAIVLVCADLRAQQAFTVEQLLDRATSYVEDLVAKLSRVVAEEQYVQEYLLSGVEGSRGSFLGSPKVVERRTLKSDLLLVKPAGLDQWLVFRDVFEVDARPVRDRENRLAKLFLDSRDTSHGH